MYINQQCNCNYPKYSVSDVSFRGGQTKNNLQNPDYTRLSNSMAKLTIQTQEVILVKKSKSGKVKHFLNRFLKFWTTKSKARNIALQSIAAVLFALMNVTAGYLIRPTVEKTINEKISMLKDSNQPKAQKSEMISTGANQEQEVSSVASSSLPDNSLLMQYKGEGTLSFVLYPGGSVKKEIIRDKNESGNEYIVYEIEYNQHGQKIREYTNLEEHSSNRDKPIVIKEYYDNGELRSEKKVYKYWTSDSRYTAYEVEYDKKGRKIKEYTDLEVHSGSNDMPRITKEYYDNGKLKCEERVYKYWGSDSRYLAYKAEYYSKGKIKSLYQVIRTETGFVKKTINYDRRGNITFQKCE